MAWRGMVRQAEVGIWYGLVGRGWAGRGQVGQGELGMRLA